MHRPGAVRAQQGLTLLELMVVIAVLALLFAALPTGLFTGKSTVQLRAAARDVASGLKTARSQAISRNEDVGFFVDVDARLYGVEGTGPEKHLPETVTVEMQTAAIERLDESRAAIRFFPDGSSTGGSITVRIDQRGYTVAVDWLTGHVTVGE